MTTRLREAWPFLVARGRNVGYQVITAPRFLIDTAETDVLHDPAIESAIDRTAHVATSMGPLWVTAATETVTEATVGVDLPLTDQHGRPLEILYGFLTASGALHNVDERDLHHARRVAIETYRNFLREETDWTVAPADPFPAQSLIVSVSPDGKLRDDGSQADEAALPSSDWVEIPNGGDWRNAQKREDPRRLVALIAAIALITLGVFVTFSLRPGRGDPIDLTTEQCETLQAAGSCRVVVSSNSDEPIGISVQQVTDQAIQLTSNCGDTLNAGAECTIDLQTQGRLDPSQPIEIVIDLGPERTPVSMTLELTG